MSELWQIALEIETTVAMLFTSKTKIGTFDVQY